MNNCNVNKMLDVSTEIFKLYTKPQTSMVRNEIKELEQQYEMLTLSHSEVKLKVLYMIPKSQDDSLLVVCSEGGDVVQYEATKRKTCDGEVVMITNQTQWSEGDIIPCFGERHLNKCYKVISPLAYTTDNDLTDEDSFMNILSVDENGYTMRNRIYNDQYVVLHNRQVLHKAKP